LAESPVRGIANIVSQSLLEVSLNGGRLALAAGGPWTADHADDLERLIVAAVGKARDANAVDINMGGIERLDTYGAWLLERLVRGFAAAGRNAEVVALPERYRELVAEAHQVNRAKTVQNRGHSLTDALAAGRLFGLALVRDALLIVQMLGAVAVAGLRCLARPWTFRLTSTIHHLDRVGLRAAPIVILITFLLGGIIAQQGLFHFRRFGIEIYVVDMVGILVLRELGVTMVAMTVAGRSGSSYTAELGSMKMREEIDALRTMGFDPVEMLILPRIVALVIALPALSLIGAIAALYGAFVCSSLYAGMSAEVFLSRLRDAISFNDFVVGMAKGPFIALFIGIVACVEGLNVTGSTESLGRNTTASVVKSIFLVIVIDGLFAFFFAAIEM
jgi:phospholipid/cholesterol/gamma-HCH transport system permease protein